MMKSRFLLTSVSALSIPTLASAGGYVAPIIEAIPAVTASGGGSNTGLFVGGALVLCAIFCGRGGDRATLPPGDHGGPCFREGTMIGTPQGWQAVGQLKVGDMVETSKGAQEILSVESWQPTEFKDRPARINGVYVSANHCVLNPEDASRTPAVELAPLRHPIDGARYYHILVRDHAWLYAASGEEDEVTEVLVAESLFLTADMKPLADKFPILVEHHAANPCDVKVAFKE